FRLSAPRLISGGGETREVVLRRLSRFGQEGTAVMLDPRCKIDPELPEIPGQIAPRRQQPRATPEVEMEGADAADAFAPVRAGIAEGERQVIADRAADEAEVRGGARGFRAREDEAVGAGVVRAGRRDRADLGPD